jgi:hypothetical protein
MIRDAPAVESTGMRQIPPWRSGRAGLDYGHLWPTSMTAPTEAVVEKSPMTAHLALPLGPILLLALVGCAANAPPAAPPRQVAFDSTEYVPYGRPGTGQISGQVLFQIESDQVKPGAGKAVILSPVTSYSTEWWLQEVVGGRRLQPADARVTPFQRVATADRQGRFRFEGLPPGEYYLASWSANSAADQRVGERVRLEDGEQLQLVLDDLRTTPIRRQVSPADDVGVAQRPSPPRSRGSGSDSASGRPSARARAEDRIPTDPRVLQAVHDLKRLQIATQVREVAPGLLVARIGPEALSPGTALAYELERLYVAYSKAVGLWDRTVIELWDRRRKVGEYTSSGLLLGRE